MADGDYERLGPRQAELARLKRLLEAARDDVLGRSPEDGRQPRPLPERNGGTR